VTAAIRERDGTHRGRRSIAIALGHADHARGAGRNEDARRGRIVFTLSVPPTAACSVLRCQAPADGAFDVLTRQEHSVDTQGNPVVMTAAVCVRHLAAIEQGEPWLFDDGRIIMGADLEYHNRPG
jgi:hypothetical protein